MLQSRIQRQIPERLSHYTSIEALKSILSDAEGKGICLWAFSNKCKNDDQEIKMGEYMLKRILNSQTFPQVSLLHQFREYENTASVSFMEGNVNRHMLDIYGHYRLEFDLRELGYGMISDGFIDCEYVAEEELEDYADEYCDMICKTYQSIFDLQKRYGKMSALPINNLVSFIMMEFDIMQKVYCLKEHRWNEEKEWRKVFSLKNAGDNVQFCNGKPYVNYFIDKNLLKGITIFFLDDAIDKIKNDANDIQEYISERGYNAIVRTERFVR